jgi:hypothetical protein
MANEPSTLVRQMPRPGPPGADDYEAFSEVLAASARGRAFLAEHARRSRSADTAQALAALSRIETLVRAKADTPAEALRAELQVLLSVIRRARPDLLASSLPARAAKLAVLLDLLERRLTALATATPLPAAAAANSEAGRAHLAVVPQAEEPELPIPSPAAAPPPVAAVPAAAPVETAMSMPEVTWFDSPPPPPPGGTAAAAEAQPSPAPNRPGPPAASAGETEVKAPAPAAPADEKWLWELPAAKRAPPADPLAALMALSEEERLALFT